MLSPDPDPESGYHHELACDPSGVDYLPPCSRSTGEQWPVLASGAMQSAHTERIAPQGGVAIIHGR